MDNILFLLSKYFYYKPLDLRKIIEGFKNIEEVMEAPKDAFLKIGISGKALDEFLEKRSSVIARSDSDEAISFEAGLPRPSGARNDNLNSIKIVTILDKNYPAALKNIYDAPPILFYRGNLMLLSNANNANYHANTANNPSSFLPLDKGRMGGVLAVVGSRKASEYGKRAAEYFVKDLAPHFIIVSGLAYGIDSLAHEIALKNNGKAIAVLGSGIDEKSIYPKSNIFLARRIIESGGLLLSEIPPGIGPQKFHFPMRNRIISGLAKGILIIEAGEKSGTLITAKLGLENGADIFAVPNNIFYPNAAGVNFLIKYGAHIATFAEDILSFYGIESKNSKKEYAPKNETEKIILDNLTAGEKHINELQLLTNMAIPDLIGTLTDLEMAGAIKNIGGKYVKIQ